MIAYKFLLPGRVGPFSGVVWRADGAWTEHAGRGTGVAACRPADLPFWLGEELWRVELGGAVQAGARKLTADRGRLLARVAAWDDGCAAAFAAACGEQLVALGAEEGWREDLDELVHELRPRKAAATAGYIVAQAAARLTGDDAAVRAEQARWLAGRLALTPG